MLHDNLKNYLHVVEQAILQTGHMMWSDVQIRRITSLYPPYNETTMKHRRATKTPDLRGWLPAELSAKGLVSAGPQ